MYFVKLGKLVFLDTEIYTWMLRSFSFLTHMIGIYMVPKLTSDIRYFVLKFMSEMSILILLLFQ